MILRFLRWLVQLIEGECPHLGRDQCRFEEDTANSIENYKVYKKVWCRNCGAFGYIGYFMSDMSREVLSWINPKRES